MRRRSIQVQAARLKQGMADEKPEREIPKGDCPHCGEHIGRGVYSHAKKCEGK